MPFLVTSGAYSSILQLLWGQQLAGKLTFVLSADSLALGELTPNASKDKPG